MDNPSPVNLQSPAEVRAAGWAAESRDDEGHLMTSHAPFESDVEMVEFICEELARGHMVTIWPHEKGRRA